MTAEVLSRDDVRDDSAAEDSGPLFERGVQKYLPAALGIILAIFATRLFVQLGHPFLSHDDWDNLLPPDEYRERLMWNRLLFEGRWLNWGLWHLGGWVLTPITATALYFGAYSAFVLRFTQRLVPGWWGVVVAAALFVSPMVCEAGYWPAILGPSMVVLALAAWSLPLLRHRTGWLLGWLGVFTLLAMLSYQPVALLLFLMLMVEERHRPLRQLAALAVAFAGVWAMSVLATFTLNWFGFGVFGVQPQAWRKPNPLEDVNDLVTNLGVAGGHFALIFTTLTVPVLLGVAAIAGCLVVRGLRKHAVVLLLATLVSAVLESVSTIVAGFVTPFRSSMWVWLVIVVAISYLIGAGRGIRSVVAAAAAGAVAISGSLYWTASVATRQEQLSKYDAIASELGRVLAPRPDARVIIVGSERDWKWPIFAQQATYLQSRTIDEYGIKPSLCKPDRCGLARDPDVFGRDSSVFEVGNRIVVRPPASSG